MQTWSVQEARAQFGELLETCLTQGPQMVTQAGVDVAVLAPVQEWRRLQSGARLTLKQLLLSDEGRTELAAPARGQAKRRRVVT